MGSPTDLTDLSHGSIIYWLWLLFLLLSNSLNSFRSFFSTTLPRFRWRSPNRVIATPDVSSPSSSSSSCDAVDDQLTLNRRFSTLYSAGERAGSGGEEEECVVCLSALRDGDSVRELDCRHVFHEGCLHGWLRRRNFTCPVCRSPVTLCRPAEEAARGPGIVAWVGTSM